MGTAAKLIAIQQALAMLASLSNNFTVCGKTMKLTEGLCKHHFGAASHIESYAAAFLLTQQGMATQWCS